MADREVSWGDEPEEQVFVPTKVAAVEQPKIQQEKKEKEPMAVPEWSIDTRGDLPTERALESSERSNTGNTWNTENTTSTGNSGNSGLSANSPSWPEEETTGNGWDNSRDSSRDNSRDNGWSRDNGNSYGNNNNFNSSASANDNGFDSRPPLTRRIGRDPVPSREREPREFREPREPREPRGNDSNGGAPRRSRNLDDLSTLNLPGVDLSKMPQATTRLSFSNNKEPREGRREERREDRRESRSYERNDVNERVNRITREVEEMGWGEESNTTSNNTNSSNTRESSGWGDEPEASAPVAREREPVKAASPRLEDNGWGEEPASEPVREPVRERQPEPMPAVRVSEPAKPVKVSNATARIDDDGWGDEPEPVKAEPVRTEPVRVEPARAEPIKVSEPVKIAEPVRVSEPARTVPFAPVSASAEQFVPAAQAQVPTASYQPMMMPTFPQLAQMSPTTANPSGVPAPYMIPHHPMSPVGQMPMSVPMSCMPGMMMPIWVTCPFCYHCYMYPPVAPGAGPAPGATTLPQTSQN